MVILVKELKKSRVRMSLMSFFFSSERKGKQVETTTMTKHSARGSQVDIATIEERTT